MRWIGALGLRALGSLAFTPLLLFAAGAIPNVLVGDANPLQDAVITSGVREWPFDEGILRSIIAIVTSVFTAIAARLILGRLGF